MTASRKRSASDWIYIAVLAASLVAVIVAVVRAFAEFASGNISFDNLVILLLILLTLVVLFMLPSIIAVPIARRMDAKWSAALTPGTFRAIFYLRVPRIGSNGRVVTGELRPDQQGLATRTIRGPEHITPWTEVAEVEVRQVGKPVALFPVLTWTERSQRRHARVWDATAPELSAEQLQELANEFVRHGAKAKAVT